jgi:hypothetical protein
MRCWVIAAGGILATAAGIVWGLALGYALERDRREHADADLVLCSIAACSAPDHVYWPHP